MAMIDYVESVFCIIRDDYTHIGNLSGTLSTVSNTGNIFKGIFVKYMD